MVGEHIDCLDTLDKWCNAEIQKVDREQERVFVHYTGFHSKYDEWIGYNDKNKEGLTRMQK